MTKTSKCMTCGVPFHMTVCMNDRRLDFNLVPTVRQESLRCVSHTWARKEQRRADLAALFCTICSFFLMFFSSAWSDDQAVDQVGQNKRPNNINHNTGWNTCRTFLWHSDVLSDQRQCNQSLVLGTGSTDISSIDKLSTVALARTFLLPITMH